MEFLRKTGEIINLKDIRVHFVYEAEMKILFKKCYVEILIDRSEVEIYIIDNVSEESYDILNLLEFSDKNFLNHIEKHEKLKKKSVEKYFEFIIPFIR